MPVPASIAQHTTTFDFDGDGATNEGESIAGTAVDASSVPGQADTGGPLTFAVTVLPDTGFFRVRVTRP